MINTYRAIKRDWASVARALARHQRRHGREYYYEERSRRRRSPIEQAAQLIYLNRTCWNGLYRVNLDGEFNVPIGTKDSVLLETDNFEEIASRLRSANLLHGDFEPVVNRAERGDFLFVDPPYTVNHNMNGFLKYNERIFTWNDQIRLANALRRARDRGAKIVLMNADHDSIKDLYSDLGSISALPRQSIIAGSSQHRRLSTEVIITAGLI